MIPKLFAPILMTLGILIGVQIGKPTSNNPAIEVDFFSFEKNFAATIINRNLLHFSLSPFIFLYPLHFPLDILLRCVFKEKRLSF